MVSHLLLAGPVTRHVYIFVSKYYLVSSYLNTKYIYAFARQLQIIRLGLQETRLRRQRPLTESGDTEALGQLYLRRAVEQTLE